jgi:hypothetical protein
LAERGQFEERNMMTIVVSISTAAAVRAGRANAGRHPVQVDDAWMASLTTEEREVLLKHDLEGARAEGVSGTTLGAHLFSNAKGNRVDGPVLNEATPEAVKAYLSSYVAHYDDVKADRDRMDVERARAKAEVDGRISKLISTMHRDDIVAAFDAVKALVELHVVYGDWGGFPDDVHQGKDSERVRELREVRREIAWGGADPLVQGEDGRWYVRDGGALGPMSERMATEAKDEARRRNKELDISNAKREADFIAALTAFVAQHGTPVQSSRRVDGLMSDEEALKLLRDSVFAPIGAPKYVRLSADDVDHVGDDYEKDAAFGTSDDKDDVSPALTDAEYLALQQIRTEAKGIPGATVTSRVHEGWCSCKSDECDVDKSTVRRASALVTVTWNGRELSREYALKAPLFPTMGGAVLSFWR